MKLALKLALMSVCGFMPFIYADSTNELDIVEFVAPNTCENVEECPRDSHPEGEQCPFQPS